MAELDSLLLNLSLYEKSAFNLDKVDDDYVLGLDVQRVTDGSQLLAATCSNHTIRLVSRHNLALRQTITGHTGVVTDISWGKSDTNLLYSCSQDQTIRCWDVRTKPTKEVQWFKGSSETCNQFLCVDVNANDRIVCAGLEADKDKEAFVLFWDRRAGDLLGAYSDSHEDDITQVSFHPSSPDSLVTGSTDGLVCVFDVGQESEDDAIQYTFNSCATVARAGWCGRGSTRVYCTTHMDTLHIWDSMEGDPVAEWTDLKETLKDNRIDYIVDLLPYTGDQTLVVGGTHGGEVKVIDISEDTPKVKVNLSGGHTATVRCAHWDNQANSLVTGGEDSMLCLWSGESKPTVVKHTSNAKMKTKKPVSKKKNPY